MKLVKDLQKWIDGYNEVKTLADELELSFDFYKEELVTEGDVDAAYAKASEAVEALELKNMLRDEADQMACVLKINSGAGGTESQDWASMLMRMYLRYAETNGYKATIANLQEGDEAGIKTCTINIEGDFAYGYLKGENGVHRLVRVSPFDANARRQTSFAALEVMPELDDDSEIEIRPEDIEMQACRSSGAGGQHVNKTESAIRITHLPTGTVVECQDERSQYKNKDRAMKILRSKLYEAEQARQNAEIAATRRSQVGTGDRSGKIRTYNFPQNRVTDHRLTGDSKNFNLAAVINGDLDALIDALTLADQTRRLQEGYEKGE